MLNRSVVFGGSFANWSWCSDTLRALWVTRGWGDCVSVEDIVTDADVSESDRLIIALVFGGIAGEFVERVVRLLPTTKYDAVVRGLRPTSNWGQVSSTVQRWIKDCGEDATNAELYVLSALKEVAGYYVARARTADRVHSLIGLARVTRAYAAHGIWQDCVLGAHQMDFTTHWLPS